MFDRDQDTNVIIDNIDDIDNDIVWLKDDVKQYANSNTSTTNYINNRSSIHRKTTVVHRVPDNELKNYMETYKNFSVMKTTLEKKPMNPDDIIRGFYYNKYYYYHRYYYQ